VRANLHRRIDEFLPPTHICQQLQLREALNALIDVRPWFAELYSSSQTLEQMETRRQYTSLIQDHIGTIKKDFTLQALHTTILLRVPIENLQTDG
jgi:hypothetical protein